MKPISPVVKGIPEVIYAENQPEYIPLSVIKCEDGRVIARWYMSFWERLKVLFTGSIYVHILIFNKPLAPSFVSTDPPKFD